MLVSMDGRAVEDCLVDRAAGFVEEFLRGFPEAVVGDAVCYSKTDSDWKVEFDFRIWE